MKPPFLPHTPPRSQAWQEAFSTKLDPNPTEVSGSLSADFSGLSGAAICPPHPAQTCNDESLLAASGVCGQHLHALQHACAGSEFSSLLANSNSSVSVYFGLCSGFEALGWQVFQRTGDGASITSSSCGRCPACQQLSPLLLSPSSNTAAMVGPDPDPIGRTPIDSKQKPE